MQKISVHVPDEMKLWIALAAKTKSLDESEVIRAAIDEGLKIVYPKTRSARALLDLAQQAERLPGGAATSDVSVNHDFYAWGGQKRARQ